MFVKVGCELGDTSTSILWDAIATDPDRAYVQKVLLTPEEAMANDFLFKYKLIYPAGSHCPDRAYNIIMYDRNEVRYI